MSYAIDSHYISCLYEKKHYDKLTDLTWKPLHAGRALYKVLQFSDLFYCNISTWFSISKKEQKPQSSGKTKSLEFASADVNFVSIVSQIT